VRAATVCSVPGCPEREPGPRHPSRAAGSTRAWRKLREQVLRRDGYTCQRCGGRAELVHHPQPVELGSRECCPPELLESLCWPCHRAEHRAA
jgi:5-methylcytosine-specific restriction endonuclease McrA